MRLLSVFLLWSIATNDVVFGERGARGSRRRGGTRDQRIRQGSDRRLRYYYAAVNKQKAIPDGVGGGGVDRDPNALLARTPGSNQLPTKFPTKFPTKAPSPPPTPKPNGSPIVFDLPVDEIDNPGVYQDPFNEMDDPELEQHLQQNGTASQALNGQMLQEVADRAFGPFFSEGNSPKKIKGGKHFRNAVVDSYPIGNKRLYGVTTGMNNDIYMSELYFGGIYKLNVTSGMLEHVVPSFDFFQRPSAGIAYARDALFVAGLGPAFGLKAAIHVYGAKTGEHLVSCEPEFATGQLLDVAVVGNMAYVTDSVLNQLVAINVDDAIHGMCNVTSIFLPFNSFLSDDVGPAELGTGIVGFQNGLVLSNHDVSGIFYHDFELGTTTQFLFSWDLPARPTGLSLFDRKYLFVSHDNNEITMWKLRKKDDGEIKAQDRGAFQTELMEDQQQVELLNGARSIVFVGMALFAVNSKLSRLGMPDVGEGYPEEFDEEFDLVAIVI